MISKFPSVNILLNPDCSPVLRILSFKPEGVCPVICFVLFFPEKIQESPQSRRPSRELGGQWGLWRIKEVLGVVWEQKMQPQPSIFKKAFMRLGVGGGELGISFELSCLSVSFPACSTLQPWKY